VNRRQFIASTAAAGLTVPAVGRAVTDLAGADRKFVFVFAWGGWDITRGLAPEFANPLVSMEADAAPWNLGDLTLVDHADRPSVRTFFETWGSSTLALNGILVPSVAHETCNQLVLTGNTRGDADWATRLAAADPSRYVLPHLVLYAPSYAGELNTLVARSGYYGQLEDLVTGELVERSALPVELPRPSVQGAVDRYLQRRAALHELGEAARGAGPANLAAAYRESLDRSLALKAMRHTVSFAPGSDLSDTVEVAANALSTGLSRCVTLGYPTTSSFDTHADNARQSPLWEGLFDGLIALRQTLEATPAPLGGTLADETVVVVLSEMGRTPGLNGQLGKDHWPWTSLMMWGPGVAGGRTVGRFDDGFFGQPVDLGTGELSPSGTVMTGNVLGATLMALADLDPAEHALGGQVLSGVLDL